MKTLYDYLPESMIWGGTTPDSSSPISGGTVNDTAQYEQEPRKVQVGDLVTVNSKSEKCVGKSGEVDRVRGKTVIVKFNDKTARSFDNSEIDVSNRSSKQDDESNNRALRNLMQLAGLL